MITLERFRGATYKAALNKFLADPLVDSLCMGLRE
jgi:hypothetical protein